MSGFALIHRTLLGHPAFRNDAEAMAFAWLVLRASWRRAEVRYKGHRITLKRGQMAISMRDMATSLDRDKAWVERLWKRLKSEAMIETATETGVTVVTIRNYDEYQQPPKEGETPREPRAEAANETEVRQRRDTEQLREQGNKVSQTVAHTRPPSLPADVRSVMQEGGFVSPPPDLAMLREWYDAGATLDQDILPVVRTVSGRLGKPPFKLKVFDAAIREKLAADAAGIEHLRRVARRNADQPDDRIAAAGAGG